MDHLLDNWQRGDFLAKLKKIGDECQKWIVYKKKV